MKIEDSLDREQLSYNLSGQYTNASSKQAMQNLYKQQLDSLMSEKVKQRELERQRELAQKKQFNERALSNKQSQKIKEQAYKNYYNMLLNNQEQLQHSYVNPFSIRDSLKDQHITHSVEQGEVKMQQYESEERKRQADRKNMYRSELMHQIQQRKRLELVNKEEQNRRKEEYRKYGRLPSDIDKYERQKHMDDMNKYKEDLDKFKNDKDTMVRSRVMSQKQNLKIVPDHHNTLINPLPYNIQNPYILREMNRQNYLAGRTNNNNIIGQ